MNRNGEILKKNVFERNFSNTAARHVGGKGGMDGSKKVWKEKVVNIWKEHVEIYKITNFQNYHKIFQVKLPTDWTISTFVEIVTSKYILLKWYGWQPQFDNLSYEWQLQVTYFKQVALCSLCELWSNIVWYRY